MGPERIPNRGPPNRKRLGFVVLGLGFVILKLCFVVLGLGFEVWVGGRVIGRRLGERG